MSRVSQCKCCYVEQVVQAPYGRAVSLRSEAWYAGIAAKGREVYRRQIRHRHRGLTQKRAKNLQDSKTYRIFAS